MTPTDFSFLVSPEGHLNAPLTLGHQVCTVLAEAGYANPRLYAEPNVHLGSTTGFISELNDPNPAEWADTSRNLAAMGVPQDFAINLSFVVDETLDPTHPPEEMNVAQAAARINKADPIDGMQEFLDGIATSVGKPSRVTASALALNLPGVKAAVSVALKHLIKPR